MQNRQYDILIIAGPTAVGESTFTNELLESFDYFAKAVSATTREPRLNEKHGVDYYFFDKETFFDEVDKGNILEWTHVKNRDAYYGSYKPDIEDKLSKGLVVIVNTDTKGAKFFKTHYGAVTIFIKPKDLEVIEDRLRRRDPSISDEEVRKRLESAKQEIREAEDSGIYDYVVWNTDYEFARTFDGLIEVLRKEGYIR